MKLILGLVLSSFEKWKMQTVQYLYDVMLKHVNHMIGLQFKSRD